MRRLILLVAALGAVGCLGALQIVEKVDQGPTARDMFNYRSYMSNGREPTFDERRRWEDRLDERVSRYLRDHPDMEQTNRYSDFRFWRQVMIGATRDEVLTLLDDPDEETTDRALMESMAKQHWASVQRKAKEAWVYPPGWVLYFDDAAVVQITRKIGKYEMQD